MNLHLYKFTSPDLNVFPSIGIHHKHKTQNKFWALVMSVDFVKIDKLNWTKHKVSHPSRIGIPPIYLSTLVFPGRFHLSGKIRDYCITYFVGGDSCLWRIISTIFTIFYIILNITLGNVSCFVAPFFPWLCFVNFLTEIPKSLLIVIVSNFSNF